MPRSATRRRLTSINGRGSSRESPAWSLDGRWIAVDRWDEPLPDEIWAVNLDGGPLRPLVPGRAHPAWTG